VLHAWIDTWLSPEFATWNLDRELTQLRSPLLAMHGDRDEFGSLAHLDRPRAFSPAPVTTKIFEGRGHVPHRESPLAVVETIAGFLESLARSRA
jgi:pimeloyl-ACP methyl ester carboxylesterase